MEQLFSKTIYIANNLMSSPIFVNHVIRTFKRNLRFQLCSSFVLKGVEVAKASWYILIGHAFIIGIFSMGLFLAWSKWEQIWCDSGPISSKDSSTIQHGSKLWNKHYCQVPFNFCGHYYFSGNLLKNFFWNWDI